MSTRLRLHEEPSHVVDEFIGRERTNMVAAAIQVVLAEKRTALSAMRLGLAVLAVPLSMATVLVTLSRFYSWLENLPFLVPMFTIATALVALSAYLIVGSLQRIRHYDDTIAKFRANSTLFEELIE